MRKLPLLALAVAAAFTFATPSNATPLGAAGTLGAATNTAAAAGLSGATDVRWRRHRHYYRCGWRCRHYGWHHRHHHRYYGYHHRHHRGVRVYIR
jgi:hypothetical protein